MDIKLSIIVPIYNIKKSYLSQCIRSLLVQKMRDMEIILVNDGSFLESCDELCRRAAQKDKRIVYINKENEGVSVARNVGMERARGEYLMFVDADDWLEEGICEKAYAYAVQTQPDVLFFGYQTNYTNRAVTRLFSENARKHLNASELQLSVLQGTDIFGAVDVGTPWGKLIRRRIVEEHNIRYIRGLTKGQDTVFSLYLFERCANIEYLEVVGYHYRVSETSVSKKYNPDIIPIMERTLAEYDRFVRENKKGKSFIQAVRNKYIAVVMGEYFLLYFFHKDNRKPFREIRREVTEVLASPPYCTYIKEAEQTGIIEKIKGFLLRRKAVFLLFFCTKAEQTARNIVIHRYK